MVRPGSLADQVQKKLRKPFKWYCEEKGLPWYSLRMGYVTKESQEVLAADGIYVEVTKEIKNNKEIA